MNNSPLWVMLGAFSGVVTGFLLNLFVSRYPRIMVRQWMGDAADLLGDALLVREVAGLPAGDAHRLSNAARSLGAHLSTGHPGAVRHPLPLWRQPVLPAACAAIFAALVGRFGPLPITAAWCGVAAALLALSAIDLDTLVLPDMLTLPLLWAGLIAAAAGATITPEAAVLGAIAGYLPLAVLCRGFKHVTGQEVMGEGDFKLLAALGAWLGAPAVLPIVVVAALIGGAAVLAAKLRSGAPTQIPFGPFLAAGGAVTFWVGASRLLAPFGINA